jgi:hypothetical protein
METIPRAIPGLYVCLPRATCTFTAVCRLVQPICSSLVPRYPACWTPVCSVVREELDGKLMIRLAAGSRTALESRWRRWPADVGGTVDQWTSEAPLTSGRRRRRWPADAETKLKPRGPVWLASGNRSTSERRTSTTVDGMAGERERRVRKTMRTTRRQKIKERTAWTPNTNHEGGRAQRHRVGPYAPNYPVSGERGSKTDILFRPAWRKTRM